LAFFDFDVIKIQLAEKTAEKSDFQLWLLGVSVSRPRYSQLRKMLNICPHDFSLSLVIFTHYTFCSVRRQAKSGICILQMPESKAI